MFEGERFDVEHALNMYALSFVTMPASGLYDDNMLDHVSDTLTKCHIYMVGTLPKVDFISARQSGRDLITTYAVAGKPHDLIWPLKDGDNLLNVGDGWAVETHSGSKIFPSEGMALKRLNQDLQILDFDVLYIGQAYGKDGSRNAKDRLLNHGTLQKISIKGIPVDHVLTLLMIEIIPATRLITIINPWADNQDNGAHRIRAGVDKMFGTTEPERITIYEAAFIRYFQPPFNKDFKDSFPSTNLKMLADCYDKDIAAVIAEISFDDMPFRLFSQTIPPAFDHVAKFNLHSDEQRKIFFKPGSV